MCLDKILRLLKKILTPAVSYLHAIAAFFVVIMAFLTTIDVILRSLFNRPVPGSPEISTFIMVWLVSFGLSYCAIKEGHIKIEFFLLRLTDRSQAIIKGIGNVLTLSLFFLITWQTALYSYTMFNYKTTSIMLGLPIFPFVALVAFGCGMFCLILLIHLLENVSKAVKK